MHGAENVHVNTGRCIQHQRGRDQARVGGIDLGHFVRVLLRQPITLCHSNIRCHGQAKRPNIENNKQREEEASQKDHLACDHS